MTQKVKEVIEVWKSMWCVEPDSYNITSTSSYVLWQSNRGKEFITPKVHGPKPPRQVFNEPINY